MALINCPECQKEISDRVKNCPNCGYPLVEDLTEIQKVEIASVRLKKMDKSKKIKIIASTLTILAIIIFSTIGYMVHNNNQNKKIEKEYLFNLNAVMASMLFNAQDSEDLLTLTGQVWYNTIYKKSDITTNEYTVNSDGDYFDDFNNSLTKFYSANKTKDTIKGIEDKRSDTELIMKELQNPPEIYKKSFDTLLELNSAYQSLIDLAINPKGSLTTFNTNKSERIDKFMELYKRLEALIPNKE